MLRLENPVRHYPWGSAHALPALLGVEPDGRPQAEMWVGAHPAAPSVAVRGTGRTGPAGQPLDAVVAADAAGVLGPAVRRRFGDRLPYLVKLLAAERPLSLQVHPAAERARRRHAEERAAGVPDAQRRYPDPWHKPELLVALAPTVALAGLRSPEHAVAALTGLADLLGPGGAALGEVLAVLRAPDAAEDRMRTALAWVLALPESVTRDVTAALGAAAGPPGPATPSAVDVERDADSGQVARRLAAQFPGDRGIVASYLLHPVVLLPGEALYVGAGVLHCYVAGLGLEVMAASDNVLRAGLTTKLVDAAELLDVVRAAPEPAPVLRPDAVRGDGDGLTTRAYAVPVAEFTLAVVDVDTTAPAPAGTPDGPRTVLGLSGVVEVATRAGRCGLGAGESLLVPHAEGPLHLTGRGRVAIVGVPEPAP